MVGAWQGFRPGGLLGDRIGTESLKTCIMLLVPFIIMDNTTSLEWDTTGVFFACIQR